MSLLSSVRLSIRTQVYVTLIVTPPSCDVVSLLCYYLSTAQKCLYKIDNFLSIDPIARHTFQNSLNIPFCSIIFNDVRMVLGLVSVSSPFLVNVLHFFIWVIRLSKEVDGSHGVLILARLRAIIFSLMV